MRLGETASAKWLVRVLAGAGCGVVLFYLVGILLAEVLHPLRQIGQSVTCQSNLHFLTRAVRIYSVDYSEWLPPADNWMDRIAAYNTQERHLHCPTVSKAGEDRFGYAMNSAVAGKQQADFDAPEKAPLLYDSTNLLRSASDALTSLPKPGRHQMREGREGPMRQGNNVGYLDGSARFLVDGAPIAPVGSSDR